MTLKEYREHSGLKQYEAAEKLGISKDYLYMIEADKRNPGNMLMVRMAELYGTKPEDIFLATIRTICAAKTPKKAS